METLIQYDSSDSSDLYESDSGDEQRGRGIDQSQTVGKNRVGDETKTRTCPAPISEACIKKAPCLKHGKELCVTTIDVTHQNECKTSISYLETMDNARLLDSTLTATVNRQEVDYFGLVNEDETDAIDQAPACRDIIYNPEKVENCGSLSVYVSAEAGNGSLVSVPNTSFWKGETSVEPIVDRLATPTTAHRPIHSLSQQTISCKRSAAVVDDANNGCEQSSGYKCKHSKTELDHSQSSSMRRQTKRPQCCYRVHHKIGPHLNQKSVNRIPRRKQKDISAHGGIVNKVEWCRPEFSHLLLSASMDSFVKVWDVLSTTPTCVQTLRFHEKAVKDATWSANGREILSGGYDRTARICDVEKGVITSCCCHDDFVTSVKWHPVNHHLFVCGSRNVIKCWDKRNTSRPAKTFMYKEPFGQVQDIVFLRDSSEFLCCTDLVARDSADRSIMAWHFDSGVVLSNQIFQERYMCTRLRAHPLEAQFVAQTQGGYIALFSTNKPYKMNKCKCFDAHQVLGYSVGCDFSPDGQLLASGSSDGSLVVYDFHRAKKIISLPQSGAVCLDVSWHPVLSSTIATTSHDGNILIWQ